MFEHKARNPLTRREALCRVGNGFGMMAFAGMLQRSLARAEATGGIVGHKLDYPQRVKRVIFLFMNGGCSAIDSFDPKPALAKYDGQPMPGNQIKTERRTGELMKSPFTFKKVWAVRHGLERAMAALGRGGRRRLLGSIGLH